MLAHISQEKLNQTMNKVVELVDDELTDEKKGKPSALTVINFLEEVIKTIKLAALKKPIPYK